MVGQQIMKGKTIEWMGIDFWLKRELVSRNHLDIWFRIFLSLSWSFCVFRGFIPCVINIFIWFSFFSKNFKLCVKKFFRDSISKTHLCNYSKFLIYRYDLWIYSPVGFCNLLKLFTQVYDSPFHFHGYNIY